MEYCTKIVKSFKKLTRKKEEKWVWDSRCILIVTGFCTYYKCRIVKAFRIFIEKGMVNDYCIEKLSEIVSAFRI